MPKPLAQRIILLSNRSYYIEWACKHNTVWIIKFLGHNIEYPQWNALPNNIYIVRSQIEYWQNITINQNFAISLAAGYNSRDVVDFLLNLYQNEDAAYYAMSFAAVNNHFKLAQRCAAQLKLTKNYSKWRKICRKATTLLPKLPATHSIFCKDCYLCMKIETPPVQSIIPPSKEPELVNFCKIL